MKKVYLAIVINEHETIQRPESINLLVGCSVNPHKNLTQAKYNGRCTEFIILGEFETDNPEYTRDLVLSECEEWRLSAYDSEWGESQRLRIRALRKCPIFEVIFKFDKWDSMNYNDLIQKSQELEAKLPLWEAKQKEYMKYVQKVASTSANMSEQT